jgi:pilus assembly protein CpaC
MKQAPAIFRMAGCMMAMTIALSSAPTVFAATPDSAKPMMGKGMSSTRGSTTPMASSTNFATVGPSLDLVIGKSTLLRLPSPIERISVGNPNVADISLISPVELYLLGKSYGSTNLLMWRKGSPATAIDISVSIDAERMEKKLRELLPEEKGIRVRPAADSVILTGFVSSAVKAKQAEEIANSFIREINRNLIIPVTAGDSRVAPGSAVAVTSQAASLASAAGAKVVNLLRVTDGQQVMLEVKIAEISKDLVEKLGVNFSATGINGGFSYGIVSNLLALGSGPGGTLNLTNNGSDRISIDANKKDSLVKVLAEPNIIAISGQEASFLAGGKLFIPFATGTGASATVSLQEREFGVGVKFTPTVLEGALINLKVAPEVSEIQTSESATVNGQNFLLPKFSTNRVQTTVQLGDGQSLAIAGLIKNNVKDSISRVPWLGEVPILGALFRSSDFTNNRTELVFLITPRLIKPLDTPPPLPTDGFVSPSRKEMVLDGQLEGRGRSGVPADSKPVAPASPETGQTGGQTGGFEVK